MAEDYQSLKAELDSVLAELQREDLGVDEALKHYKRGQTLIKRLNTYLKQAENTLTELQAKSGPGT